MGRGPIGARNAARLLDELLASRRYDKVLTPVVQRIEKSAVRDAARKVIGGRGRINYGTRFAEDLVPELTGLAVSELVRLKFTRACKALLERLHR